MMRINGFEKVILRLLLSVLVVTFYEVVLQNKQCKTMDIMLPNQKQETPQFQTTLLSSDILTRKETAKLLGINLSTLWAWTRTGKLRSYGIGNKVFYRYSEILNLSLVPLN